MNPEKRPAYVTARRSDGSRERSVGEPMLHDVEPRDPEPMTPEARFESAMRRRDTAMLGTVNEATATNDALTALRDMIASRDAELNRWTNTVNRIDVEVAKQCDRIVWIETQMDSRITAEAETEKRLARLEQKHDGELHPHYVVPETVPVPTSLVAALEGYVDDSREYGIHWTRIKREYDAWKAGDA